VSRRFRLAAVERLRGSTLADAARALGAARRELLAALAQRDGLQRDLRRTTAAWVSSPAEQESAAARRHRLREELNRVGERCAAAQGQELAALAAWNAARADLRAVEMLHERHRMTLAEADVRSQQREADEFAALTHRRPDEEDPQ
jgi:flagellar biosynthesis chaperone FliJ